ncbi:inositol monophosphatase family protein [Actinophytocola oryzae]|uniref:Inositol-1-monophosphatase n=1 Tax=Actinophytocola oryzae TaxID=502181 RepID=A0A4R7UYZ0_9PSEU|nr:inositol monophosphatase family protein [Actinophytocola oryzae]TDV40296.1 myo-inositol-1(or 4)-monophosphatase [Actinophytocola oryzae]
MEGLLDVAVSVAREAAALALSSRPSAIRDVDTKSSATDVVTAADLAVERLVRTRLAELRPGDPVFGEETGGAAGGPGQVCWVVDPIDGTVNYLYGMPWYSVSLAAQVDGVSVAAAVVEPESGREWTAVRGGGSWLDGVTLRVSSATELAMSMIATGFAYRAERRARQAAGVARLLPVVRDIRRPGSASLDLCSVAAGWVDGYFEHGLSRWDWAGGALVAEEAGAVVRLSSSPEAVGPDLTFCATPGIADQLRAAVKEIGLAEELP